MKKGPGGAHPESPMQQARIRAGLTNEKAAKLLHCSVRSLQRYEAGERVPNMTVLLAMIRHYGCTLEELAEEQVR